MIGLFKIGLSTYTSEATGYDGSLIMWTTDGAIKDISPAAGRVAVFLYINLVLSLLMVRMYVYIICMLFLLSKTASLRMACL